MGTWGPGLFSDDVASDVRNEYRELVGDGLAGPEATGRLLAGWRDSLEDPDVRPVFWLALADTQWRAGRLEPRVKEEAQRVIADGSDLARWSDDRAACAKRKKVLSELATRLASPPPPPKRLPKIYRNTCDWEVGALVGFVLRSGKHVVLRVIGHHSDRGGTGPVCELLDWIGPELPDARVLKRVGVRAGRDSSQFLVARLRENELPRERVTLLEGKLAPSQAVRGYTVQFWRALDEFLEREFGWS